MISTGSVSNTRMYGYYRERVVLVYELKFNYEYPNLYDYKNVLYSVVNITVLLPEDRQSIFCKI